MRNPETNPPEFHNHFDGYTHWYQPPQSLGCRSVANETLFKRVLTEPNLLQNHHRNFENKLEKEPIKLTANHRPFLVPLWAVDMIPGKQYYDRYNSNYVDETIWPPDWSDDELEEGDEGREGDEEELSSDEEDD